MTGAIAGILRFCASGEFTMRTDFRKITRGPPLRTDLKRHYAAAMSNEQEKFQIVTVQSGDLSVRSLEFAETFHPVIGPMAEARGLHVRGQQIAERASATKETFIVWDVGLGAAANTLAVLESCADRRVEIHSFDRTSAPLAFAARHAAELKYPVPFRYEIETLLAKGRVNVGGIEWHFHAGDFAEVMSRADIPAPHAVLYDPYSPATNADMWTLEHFTRLHARLDPARPCLLTNYTRSTAVRVTLLLAGFHVGRGHATGEKDQTTIAANMPGMLAEPLPVEWLERVERSTRGAPLRLGKAGSRIAADDLSRLRAHPQFAPWAVAPIVAIYEAAQSGSSTNVS
jgi:tRNA U34 5-methylaminomethyl-2-thiouridine-forming methyltransferase MnmC